MNLKHLSYFVDISKLESFTKAADDIYVSQSALSKSVKSLEQELNVTLIDRTSKSFNLTEEGKILFSEGEKLLQYIDESQNEIIEKICKSRRRLRIGVPPVASTVYFSHLLYRFMKKYPDIDVVISQNDDMTFGALEAIKESGRTVGIDGEITIISFDAVREALEMVAAGTINVDIECNPDQGKYISEVIRMLEAGEEIEKEYYVEEDVFTIDNVTEELLNGRSY